MTKKPIPLEWKTIKVKLSNLVEYDKNPVQISEREALELAKSMDKFGTVIPYVAAAPPNGKKKIPLADGHQRKIVSVQINKLSPDTLVDTRVPNRPLTEKEKQELIIRLRKNTGEFDFDKLANFFDVDDLLAWGFSESELGLDDYEKYTSKIESPLYEPANAMPAIQELYDDSKTKRLVADIDNAKIPQEVKNFLKIAAQRHTVLNFSKIADYYAHSDKKVQSLMEDNALVIIDVKKAIEQGYFNLSETINEILGIDYPDG